MNLGIITVIFNFCCITDSIVFYFCFNERLSKGQLFGSLILLISAYFISMKPPKQSDYTMMFPKFDGETDAAFDFRMDEMEDMKNSNAFYAIMTAFTCTLFFSARDFLLRYYKVEKKYPAFELSLDSLTLYSFGCTVYAVFRFGYQGDTFDWDCFYAGSMSAILNTVGFMMLGISVVIGYAGPANALNSIQAVVLTMLSISVMHQIPSRLQVIGMILGMVGTIIVSIGD